ncbi:hypothetical protein O7626_40390 [Micromonospora sp. WMMD1102]|nr:hypothetical protein [Micromonospora sp. WMMD1102]MDG4792078.1 hypothetical protein [Micromonospora sp. WMMD1102]
MNAKPAGKPSWTKLNTSQPVRRWPTSMPAGVPVNDPKAGERR